MEKNKKEDLIWLEITEKDLNFIWLHEKKIVELNKRLNENLVERQQLEQQIIDLQK